MKKMVSSLSVNVIMERAKTGESIFCAICEDEKMTKASRVCQPCNQTYINAAKTVDKATEAYPKHQGNQPACVIELPSTNTTPQPEKLAKKYAVSQLSDKAWKALFEEIRTYVEPLEEAAETIPDSLIVAAIKQQFGISEECAKSAVKNFRNWQLCHREIEPEFDLDEHLARGEDYIEELQRVFDKFKFGLVKFTVHGIGNNLLKKFYHDTKKTLIEKSYVTTIAMGSLSDEKSAFEIAKKFSNENGGIYGPKFKKVFRAAIELAKEIRSQTAAEAQAQRIEEARIKKESAEKAEAEKIALAKETLEAQERKAERIKSLMRRPLAAWKESNASRLPYVYEVATEQEARMLPKGTLVRLNEEAMKVTKNGKNGLEILDFKVVFSDPAKKVYTPEPKKIGKTMSLVNVYVTTTGDQQSTYLAHVLTTEQFDDDKLLSELPDGSFVAVTRGDHNSLYAIANGGARLIGPCQKASPVEKAEAKKKRQDEKKKLMKAKKVVIPVPAPVLHEDQVAA